MTSIKHHLRLVVTIIILFVLSGCASLNYYSQSIQGQFEVIKKRQNINAILQENAISDVLRNKLNTALVLRNFSVQHLGLPQNNSYLSYANLERDYVIWNIFANAEFSLKPLNWCYLIVGCLSYRGYFSKSDAQQHAIELEQQGYDVYLGGVSAYSTLGWFDDPVLNTMLRWSDVRLATVMFHELAHQQLYIKNDTEFNESYADAVAHIGVTKWLESNPRLLKEYEQSQQHERQFVNLIMHYKSKLNEVYQSKKSDDEKRNLKQELLKKMNDDYLILSKPWSKNIYKTWFSTDINNAKLAAIVTYRKYVPDFLDIYQKLQHDLTKFYSFNKSLSNCKPMKRIEILKSRDIEFEC